MKILAVHDRESVLSEIRTIIHSIDSDKFAVDVAIDTASARRALSGGIYDLLILDLTLPNVHGIGEPTYANCEMLLQEIFNLDDMHVPGDIIGITYDAESLKIINTNIHPYLMAIIPEDNDGHWKTHLSNKIQYVFKASSSRQDSINSHYDYDCLILTALDEEFLPYRQFFEMHPSNRLAGVQTFVFNDRDGKMRKGAAFSVGKSGEARAASYTQSLLSLFRPKLAIMTGICGGVREKNDIGDLVFAESAIDWDYGKWSEEKLTSGEMYSTFFSRPSPISITGLKPHFAAREIISSGLFSSPEYIKRISQNTMGLLKSTSAQIAPMASGSAVIGSDEILARIRTLNDSIRGIDMECFGFYHACNHTHVVRPDFICVKSVSDFSNGTKGDEFHEACAYVSANIAEHILKNIWKF